MTTNTDHMKARCGHHDILGYLLDTYCKACADKGHRQVTGNPPKGRRK